jgi:hypothetical protein
MIKRLEGELGLESGPGIRILSDLYNSTILDRIIAGLSTAFNAARQD